MKSKAFLPELEGIRTYAFIIVFLVHYTSGMINQPTGPALWQRLWFLLIQISWIAVPIFFVLSGYLITGVLYDSRDRQGFFSVFYRRRALRILPVYYLAIAVVAILALLTHTKIQRSQFLFLVYLQNLHTNPAIYYAGRNLSLAHLWSLAVEEQFYLVWPIVIWLLRDRISLLRFCYIVVAGCCILRLCWPLLHLDPAFGYASTFFRCDALMLGAALALHSRKPGFDLRRLTQPTLWLTFATVLLFYVRVWICGSGNPSNYAGIVLLYPLTNLMSLGLVMLCLTPGNSIHRLCRAKWACSVGSLSYGLYLFHGLFQPYIMTNIAPQLLAARGRVIGRLILLVGVSTATYLLAWLSYRYIETPLFRLKSRFQYGETIPAVRPAISRKERSSLVLKPSP